MCADRLLARQHAGDREEAGLQHGVGAPAQPDLLRDRDASMTNSRSFSSMMRCCIARGR